MPSSQSSLLYNETTVISDLFRANVRNKSDVNPFYSEQFRICPGCSGVVRFIKESSHDDDYRAHSKLSSNKWPIDDDNFITTGDFSAHVISCLKKLHNEYGLSKPLEDGFSDLNPDSCDHEKILIDFMSELSHFATGFPKQATRSFIQSAECFPYLLVENDVPVGYCSVTERYAYSRGNHWFFEDDDVPRIENLDDLYPEEEGVAREIGVKCIISDIYTFDDFRGKGYAGRMLEYVIKKCNMDTENLLVSAPLSDFSRGVFSSASTDRIVFVEGAV